ncbi:MAG: hypothetical protein Q9164_006588 [Protoblastenia rupestris]
MIEQLLGGPQGLSSGGQYGNAFKWIVDTNAMREASLVLGAEEVMNFTSRTNVETPKQPILSSACPGWICYAEKTHPHVLPHLSHLKSPQALTGTLLKTVLSKALNLRADQIWHVAVMPCFDKKLEASREELTDIYWRSDSLAPNIRPYVRDVDCVITARELLMLADTRGISFPNLPCKPFPQLPFPNPTINTFFFPTHFTKHRTPRRPQSREAGTSGGYLHHILATHLSLHPLNTLTTTPGRNPDVTEFTINSPTSPHPVFRAARYYGFRNIQNLVRKLKPPKKSRMPGATAARTKAASGCLDYAYVEVMACPGGCTNGGGQIKVDDLPSQAKQSEKLTGQKEWLARVDEAYFSMEDSSSDEEGASSAMPAFTNAEGDSMMLDIDNEDNIQAGSGSRGDEINGISPSYIKSVLDHWAQMTGIPLEKLVMTTYRKVESDVGTVIGGAENKRVEELAGKVGGGW